MKNLKKYAGPGILVLFVLILGAWHFLDTEAGAIGSGDMWLCDIYMGLFAVAVVLLTVLFLALMWKKVSAPIVAFVSILVLGSMYLVALPPISAPDEVSHFASAYGISNRILGGEAVDADGNVWMRRADEWIHTQPQ